MSAIIKVILTALAKCKCKRKQHKIQTGSIQLLNIYLSRGIRFRWATARKYIYSELPIAGAANNIEFKNCETK